MRNPGKELESGGAGAAAHVRRKHRKHGHTGCSALGPIKCLAVTPIAPRPRTIARYHLLAVIDGFLIRPRRYPIKRLVGASNAISSGRRQATFWER